ncbi:MAG TPA: YraN family protein [Stellaceae bacterium]|jgi:putative endonuclease|nr:YraN family protein [Stellaceae bacterium]
MSLAARRRAFRRGQVAELICLWHLRLRGWRILARRFRVPSGEVDLIARRGAVLAAIEVKARDSLALAAEAVGPRQRRRVARALDHFVALRPELARLNLRYDVMLVTPGRLPRHLADAWRNEGETR